MPLTRTKTLRLIKIVISILVALIIVIYAIWGSLNYTKGPKINILQPQNGATITSTTTDIIGTVERAHNLTINGNPVSIDEKGNFKLRIVVFPGINRPTLKVTDSFDRTTETTLEIVGAK
jgi:hypothetical protein